MASTCCDHSEVITTEQVGAESASIVATMNRERAQSVWGESCSCKCSDQLAGGQTGCMLSSPAQ